ncbi:hypothetical protein [Bradyrhizobium sp. HKCCYLS20291]|uniref:hypothetical protein n=1 Tax=Bradyrhizobium sp. HKCCYLS20291 TaxID=3420766 RepID=UPI003EB9CA6E
MTTLSARLTKELDELMQELRALGGPFRDPESEHADAIAKPVAALIESLRADLRGADIHLERLIRTRPIAATACALAVGLALGLLLRRT